MTQVEVVTWLQEERSQAIGRVAQLNDALLALDGKGPTVQTFIAAKTGNPPTTPKAAKAFDRSAATKRYWFSLPKAERLRRLRKIWRVNPKHKKGR